MMILDQDLFVRKLVIPAGIKKKIKFITDEFNGNEKTLDVGCVGQAIDKGNMNLWLHKKLHGLTNQLLGVDIEMSGLNQLKKLGYNVCHVNDLNDDLYDTIVMGDIIEHIGNLEEFILFYSQKLKPRGKIIITTPNPFSIRQIFNIFLFKRPFINSEHTCYIDPYTMFELVDRCNLSIVEFSWIFEHAPPKTLTSKILYSTSYLFYKIRKYYSPNFGVVCQKKAD